VGALNDVLSKVSVLPFYVTLTRLECCSISPNTRGYFVS
jgi:hypothetical protein